MPTPRPNILFDELKEFADVLSKIQNENDRKKLALEYCKLAKRKNPRFDRQKFLTACGLSD
jgi:hypothetical protein